MASKESTSQTGVVLGARMVPIQGRSVLRSGGSAYDYAVVTSLDPFIMVSPEGDMLWTQAKAEDYQPQGMEGPKIRAVCEQRLKRSHPDVYDATYVRDPIKPADVDF